MPAQPDLTSLNLALRPILWQRALNQLLMINAILQLLFLLCMLLLSIYLFPLKQTKTQYLFLQDTDIPVRVLPTAQSNNQALVEGIIRKYVINREQIFNDKRQINDLLAFGTEEVNDIFKNLITQRQQNNLYNQLQRSIEILRYQPLQSNIIELHIRTIDAFLNQPEKPNIASDWLIRIKYTFETQLINYNKININPSGLKINIYNLAPNV